MLLRLMPSPHRELSGALMTAWLLIALALLTITACTDGTDQSQETSSQQQQEAQQDQQDESAQSQSAEASNAAQADQEQQVAQDEQEDQPATESSAADAMQRDQQQGTGQQQTQDYASNDPYGEQDQSDEQQSVAPVPPVRTWLAEGTPLTPSVPAERDEYGWSAVVEGDVIAIGAPYHDVMGEDTGAVFIFERIDGEWVETAYLLPPYPDPLGWFGRWLAIGDGRIVVGAPYEDGRADDGSRIDDSGVAYVYEKVHGEWVRTGTLLPQVANAGASFGWSVAISGDRIAVAAWEDSLMGVGTGSVTTFTQHKGLWQAEAVFRPNEPSARLMFGRDIELENGVLVVGAPGDDTIAEDAGAVYVWHYYNNEWNFAGKLVAADGIANDRLGSQVAHADALAGLGRLRPRRPILERRRHLRLGNWTTFGRCTPSSRPRTCSRATGLATRSTSRAIAWSSARRTGRIPSPEPTEAARHTPSNWSTTNGSKSACSVRLTPSKRANERSSAGSPRSTARPPSWEPGSPIPLKAARTPAPPPSTRSRRTATTSS